MSMQIHTTLSRRSALAAFGALGAAAWAPRAWAQNDKPVKFILPVSAGSGVDAIVRGAAPALGKALNVAVVVENQPGAGGVVGTQAIVKAAPDGHTLGVVSNNHVIYPSVLKSVPFDPLADITPITIVATSPMVLVVNPKVPARNMAELVALLKANPGKYSYGAAGSSTSHLGVELFKSVAGVSAVHVPYKGTGPALQDTVAGQVQFMGGSIGVGLPMVQAGKLRAIAVMGKQRMAAAPDVPTFGEAGMQDFEVGTWNVVMAPLGTPKPIVERLNSAINEVLRDPSIRERLTRLGITPVDDSTPASTAETISREIVKWAKAFEASGAAQQ